MADGPQAVSPGDDADVDVLAEPRTRRLKFAGNDLEIRPMPMGRVFKVMREARPILPWLAENIAGKPIDANIVTPMFLYELGAEHGETLNKCIAIAAGVAVEQVDEAAGDVWLELVAAVINVNKDFFFLTLSPRLRELGAEYGPDAARALRDAGAGATASTPSSEPDTG